jgi:hypothetical protein
MLRAGTLIFCLITLLRSRAIAWENNCSHPKITDNAISLLYNQAGTATQQPLYAEFNLQSASGPMEAGALSEDLDPDGVSPLMVLNHFYDPHTHLPLHDGSAADDYHFVTLSLLFAQYPQSTAVSRGEVEWSLAVNEYKYISKNLAYITLGHALHLLTQDMTKPAHVHNDPHVPPNPLFTGYGSTFQGLNGSNSSPLEIGAENACLGTSVATGEFLGSNNRASIPTSFPTAYGTPEQNISEGAAEAAYEAATFWGETSFGRTVPAADPDTIVGQATLQRRELLAGVGAVFADAVRAVGCAGDTGTQRNDVLV